MISIRTLNRNQLLAFVADAAFESLPFLPISRHRAASHAANPRAEDGDVLLLLAYEGEVLVGYLGVLPDALHRNGQQERCGWLSCLWVSEQHRGKRIAQQLLEQCFALWDRRILVTEFTGPAKALYDRSGIFRSLADPKGLRLYLRADLATLLPPKKALFQRNRGLLALMDKAFNAIVDIRLPKADLRSASFTLEPVMRVDAEAEAFIHARQEQQLFQRGAAELNWILANPWILSAPEKDALNKRYHFSSVEKCFAFHAFKVRGKDGALKAFLLFAQRNHAMKLPYCYHDGDLDTVWNVVRHQLLVHRCSTFTVFHPELCDHIRKADRIALYRKPVQRNYIVSTRFDPFLGNAPIAVQDGDADCSFT
jgi:GNAT superfamily N-acetyltransferase